MRFTEFATVLALFGVYGARSAQEQGIPATTLTPATVVAETRLGPTAGNGTQPFRATVDTRHNRLWVLNRTPQSVSAVDLTTHRVLGVVRLDQTGLVAFEGWDNSDPNIWIGYDRLSDRVLVSGNSEFRTSMIVSIDAARLKIASSRMFKDRYLYCWTANSRRGEVVAAGSGWYQNRLTVTSLNSKTLETSAEFTTDRRVQALAASSLTGALYTVEPSHVDPTHRGGPYSATRVFQRDAATGKILAQSSDDCAYPRLLLPDDRRNLLYLVYRSTQPHLISSEVNTVAVFKQDDLKCLRTIHYPDSNPYAPQGLVTWNHAVLDEVGNRLIVDMNSGNLAVLPLSGPARATRFQLEDSLYSRYHLAGVLQHTGQPVILMDNAVRLLNSTTLKLSASILLGATIQDLFLEEKRHRLLAQLDRNVHEFVMLEGGSERRLFKSNRASLLRLLAVDFNRELIYEDKSDGWGNAANLVTIDFKGRGRGIGSVAEGEYAALIPADSTERTYRLLFPAYPESVNAKQHRSIDLVIKGRVVFTTPVLQDPSMMPPSQLLRSNDYLYLVNGLNMSVYSASDIMPVRTLSLSWLLADRKAQRLSGALTVDAAGEFAYYADPIRRRIVMLSLADGDYITAKYMTFAPTLPRMDTILHRLYLADNEGGRVVAIALF